METKYSTVLKMARVKMALRNGGKFTQQNMTDMLNKLGIQTQRSTYANWEGGFSMPPKYLREKLMDVLKKKDLLHDE